MDDFGEEIIHVYLLKARSLKTSIVVFLHN